MSANITGLIPELQPFCRDLLAVAGAAGLQPRITSTLRSSAEQTRLYRRFLAGQNPYPVAPPGTSAHEFGYAFDMMIQSTQMDADLADLGYVWKQWGGIWGGEFNDPIHFEYPGFSAPKVATPDDSIQCGGLLGVFGAKCTTLYKAEDYLVDLITPSKATIVELLVEAGYPESTAAKIAARPISELHRRFPWLPI